MAARQEPSMCAPQEQEEGSTISGLFRVADDCCTRACLRHLATWVVYGGWLVGLLQPVGKFCAYVSATEECAIKIRWILANGCEVFVAPAAPAAPAEWNPEPSGRQFSPLQMPDGSHMNSINLKAKSFGAPFTRIEGMLGGNQEALWTATMRHTSGDTRLNGGNLCGHVVVFPAWVSHYALFEDRQLWFSRDWNWRKYEPRLDSQLGKCPKVSSQHWERRAPTAEGDRDAEAVLPGGLLCIDMIERTSNI
ncbi:hypothetical protein EAH_00063560 [Eimeria acervulina]|uniref:Uncharacterized protein n=1 Tax=Eimeria acervulina TaxID=5801 RepID=U6GRH9_EIMAC|nr:hypothetical protein EAH_00063560 [Eimeria acervulina]CDI81863.1 hypothetical protein EAH_00063560 [Eimeria acervulina]